MSMNLTELFQAQALNKYYAGVKGQNLAEAMFPAVYSNNFDFNVLQGLNNQAVEVLKVSEYDAQPLARDWGIRTHSKADKEFFRERMVINEKQRKELFDIMKLEDEELKANYIQQLFEEFAGKYGFLASVRAITTYTVSDFLATGTVTFLGGNGSGKKIDYKLDTKYKETLSGTSVWSNAAADPIEDLKRWKEILEDEGKDVEIALMNKTTYKKIRNNTKVQAIANNQTNFYPIEENYIRLIEDLTGLKIKLWDEKVKVNGTTRKVFPDNVVTLIPNGELGKMEFGPSPIRVDKQSGLVQGRDVVDVADSFAMLEVAPISKGSNVLNVEFIIEMIAAPNPGIVNNMFIATVE